MDKRLLVIFCISSIFFSSCEKPEEKNPWYDPDEEIEVNPSQKPVTENGKVLYNGIVLPEVWPPKNMSQASDAVMDVPWLTTMHPGTVTIDVGRQLFIDDFLISETTLKREYHKPVKYSGNPIMTSETDLERPSSHFKGAVPKDGGIWWEPKKNAFMMWYEAGWLNKMAYAESKDGLIWERPAINSKGTNELLSISDLVPNSCAVVLDYNAPENERYKMFFREPNANASDSKGWSMVSEDGFTWVKRHKSGYCGDRSTMFYNPFTKKWVYSIRSVGKLGSTKYGRTRYYHESSDFLAGAAWEPKDVSFWCRADRLDDVDPQINLPAQLYNVNAVAYESVMLGIHQILVDENEVAMAAGRPKVTDLKVSFSRDGFHWHRPDREAFISSSRKIGEWDRGYVQSVGGICAVMGDELWFWYSGFRGNANRPGHSASLHDDSSTGLAKLRRDGFASMSGTGELKTVPVVFTGKHMFVNVATEGGKLLVEVIGKDGRVISGFERTNCKPLSVDSTIAPVEWNGKSDLSELAGREVRFVFVLDSGALYSFWVSQTKKGESNGYVAGGGPGYSSNVDTIGIDAYNR